MVATRLPGIWTQKQALKTLSAAFGEPAKMTGLAAFFKADNLAAFGAGCPDQRVNLLCLLSVGERISFFQDTGDGIRNGEHKAAFLEDWMLAADAFELFDDILDRDARTQSQ